MKNLITFSPLLLVLLFSCVPPQREVPEEPHAAISFQVFYDDLSPYGHWMRHPSFGYVWLPMDDPDFLPYSSHGHWVWTDYGWSWVSEYPWGWAPFHYGRWDFDPGYGWFWVPDNVWGPAWVVWKEYPSYYGWAPMRPGINITIVIGGGYHPPEAWWTFCHRRHFGRHDMKDHFEPRRKMGRIKDGESRIIDNTFKGTAGNQIFLSGPGRDNVQSAITEPIERVTIENNSKPGESLKGNIWSVYKPNIEQTPAGKTQPVPKSFIPADDVRKSHETVPAKKSPAAPNVTPHKAEPPKQAAPQNSGKEKMTPKPVPSVPAPTEKPRQVIPRRDAAPKDNAPAQQKKPKQDGVQQSFPSQPPK